MSSITAEQASVVLRKAELLCTPEQVEIALDRLAAAVAAELEDSDPLVLVVMNGAFMPGALLLSRLRFPLRVGYLHATRYRGGTAAVPSTGSRRPRPAVAEQVVGGGRYLRRGRHPQGDPGGNPPAGRGGGPQRGAGQQTAPSQGTGTAVDFVGLEVPDRYVFGCGMDYKEYWRNLPAIYAARE
jgi:hypoxanthine phosphoribosyltransferase